MTPLRACVASGIRVMCMLSIHRAPKPRCLRISAALTMDVRLYVHQADAQLFPSRRIRVNNEEEQAGVRTAAKVRTSSC